MSDSTLIVFIVIVALIVVGVSAVGFILFSRFLRNEKEAGQRFREIHKPPKDP